MLGIDRTVYKLWKVCGDFRGLKLDNIVPEEDGTGEIFFSTPTFIPSPPTYFEIFPFYPYLTFVYFIIFYCVILSLFQ
jgi:hypothetical protein